MSKLIKIFLINKVAILQKGEYFGEEELLRSQKRKMSVVCNSSVGVLYVLNKEEFTKRVLNDEHTYEVLSEQIAWRSSFFGSRVKKFISTSQEMQSVLDKKKEKVIDVLEKKNNNQSSEFIARKPPPEKIRTKDKRRVNLCNSMIHPEDVVKTLQSSEKMKALGFGAGINSPKQNFFMLKAFAKYQEKEKEKDREISTERPKINEKMGKKQKKHIMFNSVDNKEAAKNFESKNERKILTISHSSFIQMPVLKENIVDFLRNTEFQPFRTPKDDGRKFEIKSPIGPKHLRIQTWGEGFGKIFEGFLREKSEKNVDLPLKYQSEMLKSNSKAKKTLKKYLQFSPSDMQFFKTVSCFSHQN